MPGADKDKKILHGQATKTESLQHKSRNQIISELQISFKRITAAGRLSAGLYRIKSLPRMLGPVLLFLLMTAVF